MKRLSLIATTTVFFVSVCASVQAAEAAPASSQASAELYCQQSRLQTIGTDLVCNWADNAKEACRGGLVTNVNKNTITAEPAKSHRCDNGERLVQVTKK